MTAAATFRERSRRRFRVGNGRQFTGNPTVAAARPRKELSVTDLLMLEPRDAGTAVADPVVEFQDGFYAEQGRTRCYGCCVSSSNVEIRTNSYAS